MKTAFRSFAEASLLVGIVLACGCNAKLLVFTTHDGGSEGSGGGCASCVNVCLADPSWLPVTPSPTLGTPAPHPSSDCPFYQLSWQNFLVATQPDVQGEAAFRSYSTIDDLFTRSAPLQPDALAPAGAPRGTPLRAWLGNIKQAGGREILIDQNGHTLYYGIHVNLAFADFITANGLTTASAVRNADPMLSFPAGVVELKSAWQDISGAPAEDYATYVTTTAWVPTLTQSADGSLTEDKNHPRLIRVALLALHVVFTVPGHPEFIWSTFEHADAAGNLDPAPVMSLNPSVDDPANGRALAIVSSHTFPLYRANTPANQANKAIAESSLSLDPATQRFPGSETSVYRAFPASKSNSTSADDALTLLNQNVSSMLGQAVQDGTLSASDQRQHYRLVGAIWMDKPALFAVDASLQNDATSPLLRGDIRTDISQADDRLNALCCGSSSAGSGDAGPTIDDDLAANGPDSPFSILGGEDRLSSTSMESFTQYLADFDNCFTCHNTEATTAKGVPLKRDTTGTLVLAPKLINVSHVFSQFLLEESL
jgi:hypothetical protein